MQTPVQKLYTFTLKPEILAEFKSVQERVMKKNIGKEFKSLGIIKTLIDIS